MRNTILSLLIIGLLCTNQGFSQGVASGSAGNNTSSQADSRATASFPGDNSSSNSGNYNTVNNYSYSRAEVNYQPSESNYRSSDNSGVFYEYNSLFFNIL